MGSCAAGLMNGLQVTDEAHSDLSASSGLVTACPQTSATLQTTFVSNAHIRL